MELNEACSLLEATTNETIAAPFVNASRSRQNRPKEKSQGPNLLSCRDTTRLQPEMFSMDMEEILVKLRRINRTLDAKLKTLCESSE